MKSIKIYEPNIGIREGIAALRSVLERKVSGKPELQGTYEKVVAKSLGLDELILVSNGTIALELLFRCLKLPTGTRVGVPEIGYIAVANTLISQGLVPVVFSVDRNTLQLDLQNIESQLIVKDIKAMVVIHNYGYMCDMRKLASTCQENNIILIEDCAEAIGSRYKGSPAGSFGFASTFSFFANKTVTCGEGGALYISDPELMKKAKNMSNQNILDKKAMTTTGIGFNFRLSVVLSAILKVQLKRLSQNLNKKAKILRLYQYYLRDLPITFQDYAEGNIPVPWLINVKFRNKEARDYVASRLENDRIEVRFIFPPLDCLYYGNQIDMTASSTSIESYETWLSLPSHPKLHKREIKRICLIIRKTLTKKF